MKTRTLGRTGIEVSELALGGLFTSSHGGPREQSIAAIHAALDHGISYIDTAPAYFDSEEVIGAALAGRCEPVILSTKIGGRPDPFDPQDPACVIASVEQSLRNLRRDVIDVLFIHEPDRPGQHQWWSNFLRAEGPVLDVLDQLKQRGLVRYAGLGGTTAYAMSRLIETDKFDVVLTAANYSLLWREAEIELLPAAKQRGMGIVVGTPLQQGGLAARYDDEVEHGAWWMSPPRRAQYRALYRFLDEIDVPIINLAHRFLLSDPDISTVLSGARSEDEVSANVAAANQGPLTPDIIERVNEIAAMVPFRPYDEPTVLPLGRSWDGPFALR